MSEWSDFRGTIVNSATLPKPECEPPVRVQPDGSVAGDATHSCAVCGFEWNSVDKETERLVITAAKSNKEGPYCNLCLHLEMAHRYADARGLKPFLTVVSDWLDLRKPPNEKGQA